MTPEFERKVANLVLQLQVKYNVYLTKNGKIELQDFHGEVLHRFDDWKGVFKFHAIECIEDLYEDE